MRIEFFRLSTDPSKLQWDVTHANYSAITGRKSRAYITDDNTIICPEGGFFLEPSLVSKKNFPSIPANHESVLTWLLRSSFFPAFWSLRIMLGNEETLLHACSSLPKQFPTNLRKLLLSRTQSDVEKYLESLRANKGDDIFNEQRREQSIEIATYQAKNVPRMVESE